ncbi:uncharacterized protein LOC8052295 isoform X1 [Ixodes scapularis]|uniref:uncharacterized protein LOC8052295 isoform X1 n=1 Tax=Ixodes scapularis TaxID=6945 RepID=UPI001C38580A|nr:uncharacterized protein LOC8052295 isoform X1 [Ixodes scapularis]XP_042143449.1 uncharacterized protein LOC8052295 isoform X1 [Ixodes scapularis]
MSSKHFLDDTSLSQLNNLHRTPQATSTVMEDRTRSWLNAQPVPMQGRPSCNSSLGILSDTVFSDNTLDTSLLSPVGHAQKMAVDKQVEAELSTMLEESKQRLAAVIRCSRTSERKLGPRCGTVKITRSQDALGTASTFTGESLKKDSLPAKDKPSEEPGVSFRHPFADKSSFSVGEFYAGKSEDPPCSAKRATRTVETGAALISGFVPQLSSQEEFISAETSASMLKKLGGEFQTAEEASEESLEGQPWKQDVTRPSWLPNAQERVSISSYFKACSAPIEGLPCAVEEKGTEKKWEVAGSLTHAASSQLEANKSDAMVVPATAEPGFETFTAQSLEEMAVQELGLSTSRVAVPDGSVQGPSTSAIYHVLEDISISESPSAMVRKFIHATRSQKPPPRADLQEQSKFSGDATFKQPLTAAPRSKKAAASRDGRAEAEEAPSEPASAGKGSRHADPAPSVVLTDSAAPIRPPRRFGGGCAEGGRPTAECGRLDVEVVSKGAASSSSELFDDDAGSARCSALSSGYYGQVTPSGSRRSQESLPRLAVIGGPLQRPEVSLGHVCVGVPVPLVLTLVNLSAAAVRCNLGHSARSVADAEQSAVRVDLPSPVTLEGGRTTEVQGTFLSREAGEVLAEVDVTEAPVSGPDQASRLSLGRCCVLVRASAEVPQVSLEPRGGLRWDALPWASGKHSRRLTVTNCVTCPIPVRITVCQGEGVFSLSALGDESGRCTEAPSVCCVLPGKGQGQVAEFEVTCSTKHATCLSVDARLEVTLEGTSVPGAPLATMTLSATLLPPLLVVQGDGPLVVEGGGSKAVRVVNQGNGPLDVEFRATTPFRVSPDRAVLGPSLGASLQLSLADGAADCTGVLEGLLWPRGPRLDLAQLRGVPGTRALPHRCPLEATRRTLFWSGTQVGCSTTKSVMFRNPNTLAMEVSFAVQKHDASQFEVSVQGGGRSASLAPGSSLEVGVTFRPTRVGFAQSRLTVASRSSTSAENKSVQLYGFGGELHLRLSGLHPAGPPLHVLDMGMPLPEGATASRQIGLANDGCWDCCVCLALDAAAREGPYGRLAVTPERLVLRRNESKVVSVSFRFGGRGLDQRGEIVNLGTLRILYGFEALRQHARRKLGGRSDAASPSPDVSLLLRTFEGEQNGTDDGICIPAGALPEALLKTTSQAVVAVTCGPRPGRLQDSAVAASFAALEDTTFLN